MSYRNDEELEILSIAENDNLHVLVDYLTIDEDGDFRLNNSRCYSSRVYTCEA